MSSTSRTILIGSLIGAALGGATAWAYHELATDAASATGSRSKRQFQADASDLVKLVFVVIPVVRLLTNLFVPVDETPAALSTKGDDS